jgi:phosphotransferase system enzyme I (PtsI)
MIRFVCDSAAAAGIPVSVCGEMASDPNYARLLVGLGLRRLSMSPRLVPRVKTLLREESVGDLAELAERCLRQRTAEEVEACLRAHSAPVEPSRS